MRGLALLLVLVAAAGAATVSSAARPIALGVSPNETMDAALLGRISTSGASLVSISADWSTIAPASKPEVFHAADPDDPAYRWSALDAQVSAVVAAGLTPAIAFSGAPSWAAPEVGIPNQGPWKPNVSDLRAFVTALAARYDGAHDGLPRVRYWEVWTEPNLTRFFQPQYQNGVAYSPLYYRSMLIAAAKAIHATAAGNVVVAGNLAPFTNPIDSKLAVPPMTFLRQLLCMSADAHPRQICRTHVAFDALAMHPYTSGAPTHKATKPNDVSLGNLPAVMTLLRAARAAGNIVGRHAPQLWVTEISWDTKPPDPQAVPLALQARWTAEAVYWMWRVGVSAAFWFSVHDQPFPQQAYQSGLYFRNWRPKPTLRAWRFPFVAYLDRRGVSIWGRAPRGAAATVTLERKHAGRWQRVGRIAAGANGVFSARLPIAASARDSLRAVTATDSSLPFSLRRPPDHFYYPFGTA